MQYISSNRKILTAIFLISLTLRLYVAFFYLNFDKHALTLNRRPFIAGNYDSWEVLGNRDRYNTIAESIFTTGKIGDSDDLIVHPPLYSFFLAILYKLFGFDVYSLLLPQIFLDSLSSILVFLLAYRLFNNKTVSLVSGFFYAVNPHFILLSIQVYSETLYFFLMLAAFLFLVRLYSKTTLANMFFSGLFMALAALCRSIFLVFVPFVFIWMAIVFFKDKKRLLINCLGVFLSLSLIIAPWLARNYKLFNKIFFSKDYQLVVAKGVFNSYPEFKSYAQSYKDDGAAFFSWVRNNPGKYFSICARRFKIFLFQAYPFDVTPRHRVTSALIFYLIFPLGYFGLFRSIRRGNKCALLILLFILSVSIAHILTDLDAELRYRLPIEILLGIFASFGLIELLDFRKKGISVAG